MASATEADIEALREQLKQLRSDFAGLNTTIQNLARHGMGEAAERAAAPAEKAWAEIKDRADAVSREIQEKPVASALTAFGAGLILGLLFGGRRN